MPSASDSSFYTILGVAKDADPDEIRRAYLEKAREWHPDSYAGQPPSEMALAEAKMRQINEAWRVLGTASSRRAYNATLSVSRRESAPVEGGIRTDAGVTRIDPRLLDPEFIAARRQAQYDEISNSQGMLVRALPVLAILGVFVGILVVTAYATVDNETPNAETDGSVVTAPSPEVPNLGAGIEGGDCVSIASGPSLIERPCDASAAGRVVAAFKGEGACPGPTASRSIELSNGWIACLAPVS